MSAWIKRSDFQRARVGAVTSGLSAIRKLSKGTAESGNITNGMVRRLYLVRSLCMRGLRRRRPMELHTIGIDLGKTVFHLVGLNLRGEVVVRKKFSRTQ